MERPIPNSAVRQREDRSLVVQRYNTVMCDKCEELQRAVEHKQRRHEEAEQWKNGFLEGPTASAGEQARLANLNREADRRHAELEEARKNLKEHKATHAQ